MEFKNELREKKMEFKNRLREKRNAKSVQVVFPK